MPQTKYKWTAWNSKKGLSKDEAKKKYIAFVQKLKPSAKFETEQDLKDTYDSNKELMSFGIQSVSRPVMEQNEIDLKEDKTDVQLFYQAIKDGDETKIQEMIKNGKNPYLNLISHLFYFRLWYGLNEQQRRAVDPRVDYGGSAWNIEDPFGSKAWFGE